MKRIFDLLFMIALINVALALSVSQVPKIHLINDSAVSTNTSNASFALNISAVETPQLAEVPSLASEVALKSGPYAYFLINGSVEIFDISKMETVAKIKPSHLNGIIQAVAVSPDGNFIYAAETWYADVGWQDMGGHGHGGILYYSNVIQINATTLQPICSFTFEDAKPLHLAVAPDGMVYFGYARGQYPNEGRFAILDFLQGKSRVKEYSYWARIYDFEFSKDNEHVYYFDNTIYPNLYDYIVPENSIYRTWIYNDTDRQIVSIALAGNPNAKALYALTDPVDDGKHHVNGIIAVNLETKGVKFIPVNYIPLAAAANKEGDTLYVIGYTLYPASNNKTVRLYSIYRYTDLQPISPPYNEVGIGKALMAMPEKSAFKGLYSTYLGTDEEFGGPFASINMEISSDGKLGFIAAINSAYSDGRDNHTIVIFDLENMNKIKAIKAADLYYDIGLSPGKIVFESPTDTTRSSIVSIIKLNTTGIRVFQISNATQETRSEQQTNIGLPSLEIAFPNSISENATLPTNASPPQQHSTGGQNMEGFPADVSPEADSQPEPPAGNSQASREQGQQSPLINPQPEPPAPSFLDMILDFFKNLLGMQ